MRPRLRLSNPPPNFRWRNASQMLKSVKDSNIPFLDRLSPFAARFESRKRGFAAPARNLLPVTKESGMIRAAHSNFDSYNDLYYFFTRHPSYPFGACPTAFDAPNTIVKFKATSFIQTRPVEGNRRSPPKAYVGGTSLPSHQVVDPSRLFSHGMYVNEILLYNWTAEPYVEGPDDGIAQWPENEEVVRNERKRVLRMAEMVKLNRKGKYQTALQKKREESILAKQEALSKAEYFNENKFDQGFEEEGMDDLYDDSREIFKSYDDNYNDQQMAFEQDDENNQFDDGNDNDLQSNLEEIDEEDGFDRYDEFDHNYSDDLLNFNPAQNSRPSRRRFDLTHEELDEVYRRGGRRE